MNVILDEGAILPVKAHQSDAGFDLFAKEDFTVPASTAIKNAFDFGRHTVTVGSAVHDTGVHIEIPDGYVGFLKSKSGMNVKYGITSEGVIDAGYTGSIVVKLYNHTNQPYHIEKGMKITQLVILPIAVNAELNIVDKFEETERGTNGFGSSGK